MINNPIGFFDSGVGGLSVWRAVHQLMPAENTIYVADSLNAPYGSKTKEFIIQRSETLTKFLLEENCKTIVVACNTATTNAIDYLRKKYYPMSFIGIEPAIKPAALRTKTGAVGVLATRGTFSSALFQQTSAPFRNEVNMVEVVGEGLVERIEALDFDGCIPLLEKYAHTMRDADVDAVVLGCTHYPFIAHLLKPMLPTHVQIIDAAPAVARQCQTVTKNGPGERLASAQVNHQLYTTGNLEILLKLAALVNHPASQSTKLEC